MHKDTKLGIIYRKLESISKQDRTTIFIESVHEKLDKNLNDYYNRLQNSLNKAYTKVVAIDGAKVFTDINKQLKKSAKKK